MSSASSPPRTAAAVREVREGGGLRILGCYWRIASDDLVIPSWIEFIIRSLSLAVLVGVFIFAEIIGPLSCAKNFHLNVYLIVAIVLYVLILVNLVLLALHSARGCIWETNPKTRSKVTPLIYVNFFLTLMEFFWALTGSVWVTNGLINSCIKPDADLNMADVPLYAISGVIVATWVGIGIKIFLWCISFNTSDFSNRSSDNNENFYDSRPGCMSKIFGVCIKRSKIEFFKDVAKVLAEVFDDPSFVPTDIAAALILLHATQREERSISVVTRCSDDIHVEKKEATKKISTASSTSTSSNSADWQDPNVVRVYLDYAGAAYGYTWFLMRNPVFNIYKMYPNMTCFACCCPCRQNHLARSIENDNCLSCNFAALRAMLPFLEIDSLIHISFKNKLLEVPFFVALDHQQKKIVISIRGTLSLEDTLTDLCAKPACMSSFNEDYVEFYAHSGMLKAAEYVHNELKSKNILNDALSFHQDYRIVVTGHSLGAGTAVLVAFMLKQLHPTVKCYAFSPPGGLLNEAAAKASEKFVLSLVIGKDLVSRLSFHSVLALKNKMKAELRACKLPKYQILASGMSACCIKDWTEQLRTSSTAQGSWNIESAAPSVASSNNSDTPFLEREISVAGNYNSLEEEQRNFLQHNAEDDDRSNNRKESCCTVNNNFMKMILPGKIWHIDTDDKNKYVLSKSKTTHDFQDIIVSPKMLTDHFPNYVCDVLSNFS